MTGAKIIKELEKALERAKRAKYKRVHGFRPVYPVDAWPNLVSSRRFPNGVTHPARWQTVPIIGKIK